MSKLILSRSLPLSCRLEIFCREGQILNHHVDALVCLRDQAPTVAVAAPDVDHRGCRGEIGPRILVDEVFWRCFRDADREKFHWLGRSRAEVVEDTLVIMCKGVSL